MLLSERSPIQADDWPGQSGNDASGLMKQQILLLQEAKFTMRLQLAQTAKLTPQSTFDDQAWHQAQLHDFWKADCSQTLTKRMSLCMSDTHLHGFPCLTRGILSIGIHSRQQCTFGSHHSAGLTPQARRGLLDDITCEYEALVRLPCRCGEASQIFSLGSQNLQCPRGP